MNSSEKIFHVNPKKVWVHFVGFIIFFSSFLFFAWAIISFKGSFLEKFIIFVFASLCLFYSYYIMAFLITTQLKMDDHGFSYSQPMYSVSCEWKYIRVFYVKGILYFGVEGEFAEIHIGILARILVNPQNNWLSYFVDRFDDFKYWQNDPVLVELQKHLPYLTDGAKEHFGNNEGRAAPGSDLGARHEQSS